MGQAAWAAGGTWDVFNNDLLDLGCALLCGGQLPQRPCKRILSMQSDQLETLLP